MLPSDSPFPCYWWGTSMEIVGLGDLRLRVGTYGRYAFEQLPALPFEMRGDWLWLMAAPVHTDSIRDPYDSGDENAVKIALVSVIEMVPTDVTRFLREAASRCRKHRAFRSGNPNRADSYRYGCVVDRLPSYRLMAGA